MEITLKLKNTSRGLMPQKDDVIVYNGSIWYVTTKEDILKETKDLLEECKTELEKTRKENSDFKKQVAQQLLDMSEVLKQILK